MKQFIKRSVILSVVISLVASLWATPAIASINISGEYAYDLNGGQATIIGVRGHFTDLVIPDQIDGYPVVAIGDSIFADTSGLSSVTIPLSVTSIDIDAFSNCSSLTIHGQPSSYAEQYAKERGIPFVAVVGSMPTSALIATSTSTPAPPLIPMPTPVPMATSTPTPTSTLMATPIPISTLTPTFASTSTPTLTPIAFSQLDLYTASNNNRPSRRIASGTAHTLMVSVINGIYASGRNKQKQCNTSRWRNVVAVAAGDSHSVALMVNGNVVAIGNDAQKKVSGVKEWKDIVDIAAGYSVTVGLTADGRVVNTAGYDTSSWYDVTSIAAGESYILALRDDGKVYSYGVPGFHQLDGVSNWTDIVSIAAGRYHCIGVKSDGTIVSAGLSDKGAREMDDWKDIVAVGAGEYFSIGLKRDGTLVSCGYNYSGQTNVSDWKDVVQIVVGGYQTFGIQKDGCVLYTGSNDDGQLKDTASVRVSLFSANESSTLMPKSISGYQGGWLANANTTYKQKYNAADYKVTADMVVDGDLRTAWNEGGDGPGIGEWIEISPSDYGEYVYNGFKIANGFQYHDYKKGDRYYANYRVKELSVSIDGRQIGTFFIRDLPNGYDRITFESPVIGTTLRFTIITVHDDTNSKNFTEACISEIVPF